MTTSSESRIKGTAFRGYRRFLELHLDASTRDAIVSSLPPQAVELLSGESLLVSSMYPIELQHRFLESFARVLDSGAEEELRRLGAEVARTDLSGVYRVFIWAASVPQTLSVLTKVWHSYFSTGTARWHPIGRQNGVTRITDRYQHALHRPVVAGYIEVAIGLAGGKDARVSYEQTTDDTVSFFSRWS